MSRKSKGAGKTPRSVKIEDVVFRVCKIFGATTDELARVLDITTEALEELRNNDPDVALQIRLGEALAVCEVSERLYRLALGFRRTVTRSYLPRGETKPVVATYDEEVPPDRTACIHWLRNRRPQSWGKISDVEYTAASILDENHTRN